MDILQSIGKARLSYNKRKIKERNESASKRAIDTCREWAVFTSSSAKFYSHESSFRPLKEWRNRRERHVDTVKQELRILQKLIESTQQQEKGRQTAFRKWCIKHSLETYPNLGKVAYAVPPCYLNQDMTRPSKLPGALESRLPESEFRGERASRKVGSAFRLLNNQLEMENMDTMFIIEDILYENMLIWLMHARDELGSEFIEQHCPDVCASPRTQDRYFKVPSDSGVERHEANIMIIHKKKGVIFVQVKSVGEFTNVSNNATTQKINKAISQLETDFQVFSCVMETNFENVAKVVAIPNMTRAQLKDLNSKSQHVIFLCQEDLFSDNIAVAESETDLRHFREWWDTLPDNSLDGLEMEDIIARYVGIFSTPLKYDEVSERSQVRNMRDVILWAASRFRRIVITKFQSDALMNEGSRRLSLTGPPGSGKTSMLVLKARMFLMEDVNNRVIVVSLSSSESFSPVDDLILKAIKETRVSDYESRVFHIHLHNQTEALQFSKKVRERVTQTITSFRNLMFVFDEVQPSQHLSHILSSLSTDFKESLVWFSDSSELNLKLKHFKKLNLRDVVHCPPSIQRVLYHVDPDDERKRSYASDTACIEIPTNGPPTLSVRHHDHDHSVRVTHCCKCAEELVTLLFGKSKLNLTAPNITPTADSTAKGCKISCRVVLLVSIPDHVGSTENSLGEPELHEQRDEYVTNVCKSPFMQTIEKFVNVSVDIAEMQDRSTTCWDKLFVTSVADFQGLKSDVVVFLPGYKYDTEAPETAFPSEFTEDVKSRRSELHGSNVESAKTRCILELKELDQEHQNASLKYSFKKLPTSEKLFSEDNPLSKSDPVNGTQTPLGAANHSTIDSNLGLAAHRWSSNDIKRYNKWDQGNLFLAASRCLSQLILTVP